MMRAAAAKRQTSKNLMPQFRTHFTPARLTSRLNCPKVPGIARYRLFFLQQHATQHPHSSQCTHAPAGADSSLSIGHRLSGCLQVLCIRAQLPHTAESVIGVSIAQA